MTQIYNTSWGSLRTERSVQWDALFFCFCNFLKKFLVGKMSNIPCQFWKENGRRTAIS
jgi:hypothetical protein